MQPQQRPPIQQWWPTYVLVGSAAVGSVLWALRSVAEVLIAPLAHIGLLFLFACVLAFVLAAPARVVQRRITLGRRAPAVLLTYAVTVAGAIAFILIMARPLVSESRTVAAGVEELSVRLASGDITLPLVGDLVAATALREKVAGYLSEHASEIVGKVGPSLFKVVGGIFDLFVVIVVSLYLLLDARRIRLLSLRALPHAQRRIVARVESEVVRVFGAYIRGQLLLGLIVGVMTTGMLLALGVPYALFLGIFAGVMELVPVIGPLVSAVPGIALAFLVSPWLALWVLLGYVVIQQLENNLLVPRISGGAVGLHPLGTMLALLIGLELGGLIGGLFAVPIAGVLWVFASSTYRSWREQSMARRQPQRYGRRIGDRSPGG